MFDMEFNNDSMTSLGGNAQTSLDVLDYLVMKIFRYDMSFAPSKCKPVLRKWREPALIFTGRDDRPNAVNSFAHFGSLIATDGGVGKRSHHE